MSRFRRIFRREPPVITRRDSIDDISIRSGGPLILSPSGSPLPRPVYRRVLDPTSTPLKAYESQWRVWGAQPHVSLRSVRGKNGGIPDYFFRPSFRLLQAGFPPPRLTLNAPSRVRFCVQRKTRREVLFARQVAGYKHRSPGSGGRYNRRAESSYRC